MDSIINPKAILLVDDDAYVRVFLAEILRSAGHMVTEASSAEQARSLFYHESGNFDLLLSDVVMPGSSGLELVADLLKFKSSLNYLLMSGNPVSSFISDLFLVEGQNFISKPFSIRAISSAVERLCNQKC